MINVTGDISIAGDAGGNAAISNLGDRKQTIFADNIHLTNSAGGGNNSGAFITGPQQEIHAAGDVTLTARASGGDLPGARIGSSSTATNLEELPMRAPGKSPPEPRRQGHVTAA